MNTSETVQAAQRLLAEREAVGLKKYGTTVDRTDLSPAQWAQHLLEELSDAVLYLIRLKAEIAELEDNAREMAAGQCVHPLGIMGGAHGHALCRLNGKGHGSLEYWGVDQSEVVKDLPVLKQVLDRLPKLFEATGAKSLDELIEHLRAERQATPVTDFNLYTSPDVWTSQPTPAAAPEDAKALRVAINFPPQIFIVCEICGNKRCPHAHDNGMQCTGSNEPGQVGVPIEQPAEPTLRDDVERIRAVFAELPREHLDAAIDRLRAEREEDSEEDPAPAAAPEDAERAAYLARWKDAPEWADYRTMDGCGRVRWWPSGPLACEPRPVQGVEP